MRHHHRHQHEHRPDHEFPGFMARLAYRFARGRHGGHHGRRGHGRFAGGFADDLEGDGQGFRSGRKLSSEDLQLVILALIAEKPRHGYEIIKALDDLSHGFYVPSPGVVYPSLTYLEEVGHAAVDVEGARKLYRPTPEGLSHLKDHRDSADATISQIERVGLKMERLREAMAEDDVGKDARTGGRRGGRRGRWGRDPDSAVGRARAALKSALFDLRDADAEDEARIVNILDRATAEIRALQSKGDA
jgi:DNA-binding PadR family transcriptional regulator